MGQAQSRLKQRGLQLLALYFILFATVNVAFSRHVVHGAAAYFLAVIPAAPLIGIIVLLARYLREETDEFKRSVFAEAMLWATGVTMALTTAGGFVEIFFPAIHIPMIWVFPAFCVMAVLAKIAVRRRFQ